MGYLFLAIAIIAEVIATTALKASHEFTRFWPSLLVIIGYGTAFYFLSLVLKTVPMGVAYAVWSGVGVTLLTIIGAIVYKQTPDTPTTLGTILIISGVVVLNLFSKTAGH